MKVTVCQSISRKMFRLEYLPVLIFLLIPITTCVTFYLSYIDSDHVTYIIPYISDTGTYPPESCIFGQLMNISSILIGITMFIKYCQVREMFMKHHIEETFNINQITLHIGYLSCLGISLVGNFQETNMFTMHWIGAILTFGCGSLYLCFQTMLYFKLTPVIGQRKLTLLRIILSIVSLLTCVMFVGAAFVAYSKFQGPNVTKWKKDDGGYEIHLISTYSEWICASSMLVYILMFFEEFSQVTIRPMNLVFKEDIMRSSRSSSRAPTPENRKI